jgi:hypothetical protein
MNEFEDRERAFERKFGMDEEIKFKINSRASKCFGVWAAEQMGLKGGEAENYIMSVVETDVVRPGHEDVLDKVEQDFKEREVSITRHRMQRQMESCLNTAREQVGGGSKDY